MLLDDLDLRPQRCLTTDSPAPLKRGRSGLQYDVAYLRKEWVENLRTRARENKGSYRE